MGYFYGNTIINDKGIKIIDINPSSEDKSTIIQDQEHIGLQGEGNTSIEIESTLSDIPVINIKTYGKEGEIFSDQLEAPSGSAVYARFTKLEHDIQKNCIRVGDIVDCGKVE